MNPSVHDSQGMVRNEKAGAFLDKQRNVLLKRHMVPRWWCEGLKSKLEGGSRKKESPRAHLPETEVNPKIEGATCLNKHISLLTSIWNEIILLVASGRGRESRVQIPLSQFVRGTSHEIMGQFTFLETYWSSPFLLRFPETGRSLRSHKSISFNFVQWARVEGGQDPVLNLEFSLETENIVLGRFEKLFQNCDFSFRESGIVSLHPDVIKALGTSAHSRKMCQYLQIEIDRPIQHTNLGWVPMKLSAEALITRYKETKQLATQLYDHGALGWEAFPPKGRISQLQQGRSTCGPVIYWKLSAHSKAASECEISLLSRIGSVSSDQEPLASVHLLRPDSKIQKNLVTGLSTQSEVSVSSTQKLLPFVKYCEFEPKVTEKSVQAVANTCVIEETESLDADLQEMCEVPAPDTWDRKVLEYYLSLSDRQKEQFLEYKASLSYGEFRRQFSVVVGS